MKKIKKQSLIVLLCTVFLGASALNAAADTISASVNALAGLSPVLSLTCDDVNFGVWRVPVRSTGGATTVTLTVDNNNASGSTTATLGTNTTGVAQASGYLAPDAAVCTVSGSNNPSSTIQTAITNNTALQFGASQHNNLSNPNSVAALSADLALGGGGVAVDTNGSGTFRVVGVLTIPETIDAVNYGGYASANASGGADSATVTVTDTALPAL